MKYLQARLRTSIVNQIILTLLLGGIIGGLYTGQIGPWEEWYAWPLFLLYYTLIQLPFEFIGGYRIAERNSRTLETSMSWIWNWIRANVIMILFMSLFGYGLLFLAAWKGILAALGGMIIWMLLLTGFRQYLARLLSPFEVRHESNRGRLTLYLKTDDKGFTGGISGIPGQETIIMPAFWDDKWEKPVSDLLLARRHGALNTGSHGLGLFVSLLFQIGLFAGAAFLAQNPGTTTWLIETICFYSLFNHLFIAFGIAPLNRAGTFQMDRWVYFKKVDGDIIREAMEKTRRFQDDPGYSLPSLLKVSSSLAQRREKLSTGKNFKGAWHMASVWNFFSLMTGSLLVRSLPGVIGMPGRWVYSPVE
ncbi:MAG: hypothetical protein AAFY71_12620 [Bacteroidota bacterium]